MSATPPLFAQTCDEVIAYLRDDTSQEAEKLCKEARELRDTIRSWTYAAPDPIDRAGTINQVFDVYKRMLNYRADKRSKS